MLDREQRNCQQARSLSRNRLHYHATLLHTHTHTHTHTQWYKHRYIHAYAVETCQTARLLWQNIHKHTGRIGQETLIKQHGLYDWTDWTVKHTHIHKYQEHTKQHDPYDWIHKHTHSHAETNTQTVRPRKVQRGNFLLLQLILNMCRGLYCNLL